MTPLAATCQFIHVLPIIGDSKTDRFIGGLGSNLTSGPFMSNAGDYNVNSGKHEGYKGGPARCFLLPWYSSRSSRLKSPRAAAGEKREDFKSSMRENAYRQI